MRSADNKLQKELTMKEKSNIITEMNKILNSSFRILAFDGGLEFPNYPFYFYFGDPDKELRRYSVGVFTIWLGYWNSGCSFHFIKQSELYKYIKALVEYQEEIEKEFPVSFNYIVYFLIELTTNYRYAEETRMKPYIVEVINKNFLSRKMKYVEKLKFVDFLKELKVQDYDKLL